MIFDAQRPDGGQDVRHEILDVVAQMTPVLGLEASAKFAGDLESGLSNDLIGELTPIVREALTNVARHADASMAEVRLVVGESLEVSVIDDGRGIEKGSPRGNGLGNLTRRAVLLGGELTLRAAAEGGTELYLKVPLAAV